MFLVIELQTNNGQLAHIATAYESRAEAESKFHQILAAAAVSSVPVHAAVIVDNYGLMLASGTYNHEVTVNED